MRFAGSKILLNSRIWDWDAPSILTFWVGVVYKPSLASLNYWGGASQRIHLFDQRVVRLLRASKMKFSSSTVTFHRNACWGEARRFKSCLPCCGCCNQCIPPSWAFGPCLSDLSARKNGSLQRALPQKAGSRCAATAVRPDTHTAESRELLLARNKQPFERAIHGFV